MFSSWLCAARSAAMHLESRQNFHNVSTTSVPECFAFWRIGNCLSADYCGSCATRSGSRPGGVRIARFTSGGSGCFSVVSCGRTRRHTNGRQAAPFNRAVVVTRCLSEAKAALKRCFSPKIELWVRGKAGRNFVLYACGGLCCSVPKVEM